MSIVERVRDYKRNSIYFHKKPVSNPYVFQATSGAHIYYGKKHILKRENESCYDIRFFKKGNFSVKIGPDNYICKEKSLIIFNHFSNIEVKPIEGNSFEEISIYVIGPHLDEYINAINYSNCIFVDNYSYTKIEEYLDLIIHMEIENQNYLLTSTKIYELLIYLIDKNKLITYSKLVCTAIEIIKKNYENNITLKYIANEIGLDKYYFSKVFKKETGVGPIHFLNNIRIEKGINLLISTNKKIYEIAKLVGFTDTRNFIYLFKKKTGIRPSQYRENYKSKISY